jgi:hypothetical protein
MHTKRRIGWSLLPLLLFSLRLPAADKYKLEVLKEPAPADVSGKVRESLAAEGIRIVDSKGEPFVDVWLRKSVRTVEEKAEPGIQLGFLEEGTLLGVARFHKKSSDFKGQNYKAGIYTCRYGWQPRDGDHLGVTPTRDFILLSPAKADQNLEPMPTKDIVKLSSEVAGSKHPAVLHVLRFNEGGEKLPRLVEDEDLGHWILECEIPSEAKEKKPARFRLVIVGTAPDF